MINALPSSLKIYLPQIEFIISKWPIKVTLDHAIKWVMQFDTANRTPTLKEFFEANQTLFRGLFIADKWDCAQ